mmetsp:Transcript_2195/g.5583  ORF Transcript_2195/g.5583 Transcript_2195/m.5583 type:complete len:284 (-) Transcript_2195:259-1110(-)
MNDPMMVSQLQRHAFAAVTKAFAAGGKLTMDTEALLMEVATALHIGEEEALTYFEAAEKDPEAQELKKYDPAFIRGQSGQAMPSMSMQPAMSGRPQAMQPIQPILAGPVAPMYPGPIDPGPMGYAPPMQPAAKKQKKSGGAMGPPATMPRQASTPGSGGSKAGGSKSKARSAPSTPVGAPILANPPGFKTQQVKAGPGPMQPIKAGISHANFQRVMQRPGPEMEAYFQELNNREREIFNELIDLGVSEHDPDIVGKELPRTLLQWYKLDRRQALIEQEASQYP